MAFFKKAAKGKSPGTITWTKENMVHVNWCMQEGIYISVQPRGADWEIEIRIGENIHMDPKTYEGKEALKQMYKYYKYYYDKNNI